MKFAPKISLPDEREVRNALLVDVPPRFQAAVDAAQQGVERAQERLGFYEREVLRLPAAIAAGEAEPTELESALRSRDAARMVIPAAEERLAAAKAAMTEAEVTAKREAVRRAERFRDQLQAASDELKPVAEAAQAAQWLLDSLVSELKVPGVFGIQPVSWPFE